MSQDIIWEQFVSFPPYLCPPTPILHPHPRPVLRPQTTSPPPHPSPTWLHYPMELSRIPMSRWVTGLGVGVTQETVFSRWQSGVRRETRGPWLAQYSAPIHFTASPTSVEKTACSWVRNSIRLRPCLSGSEGYRLFKIKPPLVLDTLTFGGPTQVTWNILKCTLIPHWMSFFKRVFNSLWL